MKDNDDFPTVREAGTVTLKWGVAIIAVVFVLSLVAWAFGLIGWAVTKPVNVAVGVANRVLDPDHALQTYRWFHEAHQQIKAKEAQIALSKQALAASGEDRKEARRVELLGLQQGCQSLVSEYNARATRADTVIFQHPEQFLPGNLPGDRNPLPSSANLDVCN